MRAGFSGVDMFFVISGYLITGTSLKRIETLSDVGDFFRRRIARLLPMLTVVVLASCALAAFMLGPIEAGETYKTAAASSLFFSNIYLWQKFDYFQKFAQINPLMHTWSLGVEEQFYLLLPFLFLFTKRKKELLILIAIVSMVLAFVAKPAGAFYLLPCRIWELSAGALLCFIPGPRTRSSARFSFVSGLACLVVAFFVLSPEPDLSWAFRLLPVSAAVCLIWAGQFDNELSRRLGSKALVWVGAASYSAYLIHWPVWVFLAAPTEKPSDPFIISFSLAVTFGLAWACGRWIERPAQKWIRTRSARSVFGAFGAFVLIGAGVPYALGKLEQPPSSSAPSGFDEEGTCFIQTRLNDTPYAFGACVPTDSPSGKEKWLVWGDSFAAHYVAGLRAAMGEKGIVFQATNGGCSPLLRLDDYSSCEKFSRMVVDKVLEAARPTKIIISARWSRDTKRLGVEKFLDTLSSTLDLVRSKSKAEIVLIDEGPIYFTEVRQVLQRRRFRNERIENLSLPADTSADLNAKIRELANRKGIPVIGLSSILCQREMCVAVRDGVVLIYDSSHLTREGSKYVSAKIFQIVSGAFATEK